MYSVKLITEDKNRYLPLLLEADPEEAMLKRYLERGALYILEDGGRLVAVAVVTMETETLCELKNLAVPETERGKGYAALMLENLFFKYAQGFTRMRVGTGETLVPFYERFGFQVTDRIPHFFTENYTQPVLDAGVILDDMILLERELKQGCTCCPK